MIENAPLLLTALILSRCAGKNPVTQQNDQQSTAQQRRTRGGNQQNTPRTMATGFYVTFDSKVAPAATETATASFSFSDLDVSCIKTAATQIYEFTLSTKLAALSDRIDAISTATLPCAGTITVTVSPASDGDSRKLSVKLSSAPGKVVLSGSTDDITETMASYTRPTPAPSPVATPTPGFDSNKPAPQLVSLKMDP